jgi:hypothetical protein
LSPIGRWDFVIFLMCREKGSGLGIGYPLLLPVERKYRNNEVPFPKGAKSVLRGHSYIFFISPDTFRGIGSGISN